MPETLTPEETAALRDRVEGLTRRVDVLESRDEPPEATNMTVWTLTDSPGVVYDEGIARATPCDCIVLNGGEMCESKGVKGFLDEGQQALFCNPRVTREQTPAQKAQLEIWRDCGVEVKRLPKADRLTPYFSCIDRERKARGITEEAYGT